MYAFCAFTILAESGDAYSPILFHPVAVLHSTATIDRGGLSQKL